MKKSVKSILVLVMICAIMAVLLAVTNAITAPVIEEGENAAAQKALLQVMPEGEGFEKIEFEADKLPATVTEVYQEQNGGYVFKLSATGYKPGLVIMCGVSADGMITGAVCLASNETWGTEKTFGELVVGKDTQTVVDVEASATSKTVKGYRAAVQDALQAADILKGGSN